MHLYAFESYGVKIRIESNRKRIIERVRRIADISLLGKVAEINADEAVHVFTIFQSEGLLNFKCNFDDESYAIYPHAFYNYFESRLRVTVAEHAKDLVFLHAGAIGWKGKGIIFPANSFQGKTTLVAALVRLGAEYYSDDYAIIDADGQLHPFSRRLSIRDPERADIRTNVTAERLGGRTGVVPIPVGAVIITYFRKNASWRPRRLTAGTGLLQLIPQTIPVRENTKFSLEVLKKISGRAIIAKSSRGDAELCAKEIICFIDKLPVWDRIF